MTPTQKRESLQVEIVASLFRGTTAGQLVQGVFCSENPFKAFFLDLSKTA